MGRLTTTIIATLQLMLPLPAAGQPIVTRAPQPCVMPPRLPRASTRLTKETSPPGNGADRGTLPPIASASPGCGCSGESLPVLTVWSSPWCGPCRQFWNDMQADAAFRQALLTRFQLRTIDVDRQPSAVRRSAPQGIPAFQTWQLLIIGYQGKPWLLDRLGINSPTTPEPATSSNPLNPSKSETIDTSTKPSTQPPIVSAPPRDRSDQSSIPHSPPRATPMSPVRTTTSAGQNDRAAGGSLRQRLGDVLNTVFPVALTALQLAGVLGGTAATGGLGALALRAVWHVLVRRIRRRKARAHRNVSTHDDLRGSGGDALTARAPFPRQLDEAGELLALRQSEGRVAVLDALRGMFLDDELQKLSDSPDAHEAALARHLRTTIDTRVSEIAPLTTTVD